MQAAMTGKGIAPQGARTELSDVEAFVARHGSDLPPKELAERFQLHVSRTRMPSTSSKLDRVVRSALISTDNVASSEAAVRSMIRTGEIEPQTGIMLLNWFILLRSGRFGGALGSFAR
jgi:hypothetical protein